MDIISARLHSQQLRAPLFKEPADVVSWFGAIQAQDQKASLWATLLRTKGLSSGTFEKFREDFDSGKIVRVHLFRCTWQMIAGEDFVWMNELCRQKALSTMRGWMSANRIAISPEEEERIALIFEEVASKIGSVVKEDFGEALRERGIVMEDHRLSYHIRLGELSGRLCSGNYEPRRATYSLVRDKLPLSKPLPQDESLALLARKYFRSHSPATLEDFVWWSGLGIGNCREAVLSLGDEIGSEKVGKRDFLYLCGCADISTKKTGCTLLPAYDEYLIGYKSRDVVLPPIHSHLAHNNSGIFHSIIESGGWIVGNWSPTSKDGLFLPFESDGRLPSARLESKFRTYKKVMP